MPARKVRNAWRVDFHFGGERCRKNSPLNTEAGAVAYEFFLRKEAALYGSIGAALRANIPENRRPCPTLEEFTPRWYAAYVAVNNRPKEVQQKRSIFNRHILPEFGKMRLCDIGKEQIEVYKGKKREAGLSPKTINNQLGALHRCLTVAAEWKVLRTDVPRVPLMRSVNPRFHFLTQEDCLRLLRAAPEGVKRAMILMALKTGMRFCELSAVRWHDVDLDHGFVTVSRSVVGGVVSPPKSNRIRHIPLTADLVDTLRRLPKDADLIFHRKGRLCSYEPARKMLRALARDADIAHVRWHDLRHTFASQLVQRGASILAVQKLLGHSDIQVTMRYSHLGQDGLRNAVELLETPVNHVYQERLVA